MLLKNRHGTLPLSQRRRSVYVAGSNADNIGNQAGGWTLTWQGGSTNVIPGDDRSSTAIRATPRAATCTFSADRDRRRSRRNAAGVVVVGETPYAEGFGDVGGPQWAYDPATTTCRGRRRRCCSVDADKAGDRQGLRAAPRRAPSSSSPAGR